MAYLALYRKYRPKTFDEVIGQDHIVKTLVNQIKSDMVGHAYLFTGTRGTGKTTTAKIFAKAINCENNVNGSPCGKCKVCLELNDPSNIDVIEIDAASNNGVNEVRELRENVQYPPVSGKYKVYIIDEVHMLTGAAFNALLKTLEEPPKHAVFILATTEVHKLPATILSRCMRFDFKLVPTEQIADLIAKIYDEQGKEYEKEAVFALAKAGEGSIRDALSVADVALSYSEGKLYYKDVTTILGASDSTLINEFSSALILGNSGEVLETIEKIASLGKNIGVVLKDLISYFRDLIVIKTCKNPNSILTLPETRFEEMKKVAELSTEERLLRILSLYCDLETTLKYSINPRVLFESISLKAARPEADFNLDAITSRLSVLEDKLSKIESGKIAVVNEEKSVPTVTEEPEVKTPKSVEIKADNSDVKGALLIGVRNSGSEMLYNVLQTVAVDYKDGTLNIYTKSEPDRALLDMENSRKVILEALKDFSIVSLHIMQSEKEKLTDEMDNATEKFKKIFGDDIVIVK